MKTKSKRFLNLATLCLALLGTALLMGQPVKAEVTHSNQTHTTEQSENSYEDSHKKGTQDGYEKGKNATSETLNRQDIEVPGGFDPQGYKDGYEGGFSKGFNEANHPILTAIEGFLSWLWGLFTGEFTGEQ
ncbi:Uncharacterised protein [Streptococcus pyogenes]|uniref:hypothetical protein n=1 Tax=Streptococcus pyogenes TaxID=1314 RepID=UPI0010A1CA0E|nr:hypothetical protein [Streptococcus pyogenes]VGU80744.1 Uncharacterised protein [Streptococcus pyogenes]VGV65208.1 Uncharacterised protein [Streptococcus pyogenes]VHB33469.1 Uncharacterised protein [Streptococcus pyogenes]VHB76364.1 Uncharacterised protein [Streptococcus pyogenes]VHB76522.1 Uncharacterised protein [Streptococcus pyogenes]